MQAIGKISYPTCGETHAPVLGELRGDRSPSAGPNAIVELVNWTGGVSYNYDDSGSITRIGKDELHPATIRLRQIDASLPASETSEPAITIGKPKEPLPCTRSPVARADTVRVTSWADVLNGRGENY